MSSVAFPVFPIDYWAEKKAQVRSIVWEKGDSTLLSSLSSTLSWQDVALLIDQAVTLIDFFAKNQPMIAYSGNHRFVGLLCYLGCLKSGRQIMMLNPAMTAVQRQQVLSDNHIQVLMTDQDFAKNRGESDRL